MKFHSHTHAHVRTYAHIHTHTQREREVMNKKVLYSVSELIIRKIKAAIIFLLRE